MLVGNNYGYFRDELYVLAMSQHPAFGYVDVPPLVPWITLLPRVLTGNALWAIHVISALALVLMGNGSIYSYDVFDAFWWTLAATILIVLLRDERPRCFLASAWWLAWDY